jgi:integrase
VVTAIGAPGLYFHDLRHTGNQLVADTGAGLRDLMARMGHDSARGNVNAYPGSCERPWL